MSKLPELPVYEFTVTAAGLGGTAKLGDEVVVASYFQESGQYTVLKDSAHVAVDAFKTDTVLRIKRSVDPVDVD